MTCMTFANYMKRSFGIKALKRCVQSCDKNRTYIKTVRWTAAVAANLEALLMAQWCFELNVNII